MLIQWPWKTFISWGNVSQVCAGRQHPHRLPLTFFGRSFLICKMRIITIFT